MTKWTDRQIDVINTRGRNILVSAAAGSGKTAVLVERIIKIITEKDSSVNIDELLVVTFTRAAASEMKERVREALEKLVEDEPENANVQKQLSLIHNAHISTIDSFCASVIKENFDKIELDPNFRIADETEIEMLKSDVITEMLEEYYEAAEPQFMELANQYSAGKLSDNIGELINQLYKYASGHHNPQKWVENCIKNYNVETIEEFEKSNMVQTLLDMKKKQLQGLAENLDLAISIAVSDNGPKSEKALETLKDGIDFAIKSDTFDKVRSAIIDMPQVRLTSVKGCDEQKKQQVSDIKTAVIKSLKDLKSGIFSQSLLEWYSDVTYSKSSVETIIKLTLDFISRFSSQKEEKGIMDFNDQAHFALQILNDVDDNGELVSSDIAKQMSAQYKEIMIDEYQDSNFVQEAILSSISRGQGVNNMFMVGDVKQSIYRFRQANPKLFLGKYDTYSDNLDDDECRIVLDKNFRSRQEVIDSVNFIFDYIMHKEVGGIDYKKGNRLFYGATQGYEEVPKGQDNRTEFVMIEGTEKRTEAEYVAQKILEITNPISGMKITDRNNYLRPVKNSDIVILLRSMKGNSDIYVEQLENNGIPAYAESRSGYYQSLEIRTITSALAIIDNPLQDIPLAAVMLSPMFHFTSEELAIIRTENQCEYLYQNIEKYAKNGGDDKLVSKVNQFLTTINKFRNMVSYTSVYELINRLLNETGYDYYIMSMPNGKKRYLNIEALKEKAVDYDLISYKGLFNFIRYIEKLQYLGQDTSEASSVSEHDNIVKIMSIHKSKGLQFPVVFLCNTNGKSKSETNQIVADDKGNIGVDYIDSRLKVKAPTLIKQTIKMINKEEDMAESLRILYVALTRAKEKLFITGRTTDLEKMSDEFYSCKYNESSLMSYNDVINAKNFMDMIGKTIGKNKCFKGEIDDFGTRGNVEMARAESNIVVKEILEDDITFTQVQSEITDEIKKEVLLQLENDSSIDEEIENEVIKNFEFEYPHLEEVTMHSKVSVTELKKQSMSYEEEIDGTLLYESNNSEVVEIIPDFAKTMEQKGELITGADRGTAYHRVFELIDMQMTDYGTDAVREMIDGMVATGKLAQEQARVINIKDIQAFTKTTVFNRMKQAYNNGELYRERQFLMSRKSCEINHKLKSDESMIIQGIIDACFIEDGKYIILDYKTDRVNTLQELVERYKVQLESYKDAIEQISGREVGDMIIYSVYLDNEIII